MARRDQITLTGALFLLTLPLHAQTQVAQPDPRAALKPGFRDAGQAALNIELVSTLPKPDGFFDPKAPAGTPDTAGTPRQRRHPPLRHPDQDDPPQDRPAPGAAPAPPPAGAGLAFGNSDLAFSGDRMFVGNFNGFNAYVIENARKPQLVSSVVCPGGQGDLSVHGNLLFMSVEQTRGRVDCGTGGVTDPVSKERFRGVRIFDISDIRKPRQIAAVQTCRGSHTHTLVVDPKDTANVYIYNSGTGVVRSGDELAGCSARIRRKTPIRPCTAST